MINENMYKQFCIGDMDPKGITIHNTNNELSAVENYELMLQSEYSYSAHFFIDEKDVIQAIPIDKACCHTGKGYDPGNLYTIAIEICSRGTGEEWQKALKNTMDTIEYLRSKTGKNLKIYFHRDFNPTVYCPHRILNEYGSKINFMKRSGLIDDSSNDGQQRRHQSETGRRIVSPIRWIYNLWNTERNRK